jgi:AraC-like DNA-binding protein
MYREWADPLSGAVVWTRTEGAGASRVLPDGCMDLLWHDGRLVVCGPDTAAHVARDRPGGTYVGLRFPPGAGPRLLGAPAREVRDRRVPLEALWPPRLAAALADRAGDDPAAVLTRWARQRVREAGRADRLSSAVAAALDAGATVRAVAEEAGLGERALRRRCERDFGYGPKTLARVLRFQRALALARAGVPLARVAAESGYADQPHLAREVRSLAAVPLRELL